MWRRNSDDKKKYGKGNDNFTSTMARGMTNYRKANNEKYGKGDSKENKKIGEGKKFFDNKNHFEERENW